MRSLPRSRRFIPPLPGITRPARDGFQGTKPGDLMPELVVVGGLVPSLLIEPEPRTEAQAGKLFDLTKDWAAIIAPGLHLAFRNRQTVTLSGNTIAGETATRDVRVCGAGAFVVLKALAFHIRGENKDAYDLFYLLRNYGRDVADVATTPTTTRLLHPAFVVNWFDVQTRTRSTNDTSVAVSYGFQFCDRPGAVLRAGWRSLCCCS